MAVDIKGMGELFRQRRKELNLSLKEVENATSVRSGYLQAIEEGQMEKLISPIYAQGFIRQYASFLGMDGDRIVSEHADVLKRPINQEFSYGIGTLETRGSPGAGVKGMPHSMWIAAFFVLLVGAYYIAKILEVI